MRRATTMRGGLEIAPVLLVAVLLVACSDPQPSSNTPPTPCSLDGDCGRGKYCTAAGVCRSDCTTDAHCLGPSTTAQCNAQGRCIETLDAAVPPADDAAPGDGDEPDAPPPEGGA